MDELQELYQETILDHNRHPRNFRKLTHANCQAEGYNPLCGDHYFIYVRVENNIIQEAAFEGKGCAISKASASIMTECLTGKTLTEAEELIQCFHELITTDTLPNRNKLGKLVVFAGVRQFPVRVKCASLAWHTLKAAIKKENVIVSTE